jgi:hypothetical protein
MPFEGRGDPHQYRSITGEPVRYFVQRYGAVPPVSIHPQLPLQVNFWGANLGGADLTVDKPMSPTPTIVSRYDQPILVRRINNIPTGVPSGGFGKNSISMHLHNFHTAPDSDGGACDPALGGLAENPLTQGRFFFPGQYYDHYYYQLREPNDFISLSPHTINKYSAITTTHTHTHTHSVHTNNHPSSYKWDGLIADKYWTGRDRPLLLLHPLIIPLIKYYI